MTTARDWAALFPDCFCSTYISLISLVGVTEASVAPVYAHVIVKSYDDHRPLARSLLFLFSPWSTFCRFRRRFCCCYCCCCCCYCYCFFFSPFPLQIRKASVNHRFSFSCSVVLFPLLLLLLPLFFLFASPSIFCIKEARGGKKKRRKKIEKRKWQRRKRKHGSLTSSVLTLAFHATQPLYLLLFLHRRLMGLLEMFRDSFDSVVVLGSLRLARPHKDSMRILGESWSHIGGHSAMWESRSMPNIFLASPRKCRRECLVVAERVPQDHWHHSLRCCWRCVLLTTRKWGSLLSRSIPAVADALLPSSCPRQLFRIAQESLDDR